MAQIMGDGSELVKQLEKVGLVPANCRHIVIDIDLNCLTTIYYETLADERILKVDFKAGITINK